MTSQYVLNFLEFNSIQNLVIHAINKNNDMIIQNVSRSRSITPKSAFGRNILYFHDTFFVCFLILKQGFGCRNHHYFTIQM